MTISISYHNPEATLGTDTRLLTQKQKEEEKRKRHKHFRYRR
jgi:hypothetical protein